MSSVALATAVIKRMVSLYNILSSMQQPLQQYPFLVVKYSTPTTTAFLSTQRSVPHHPVNHSTVPLSIQSSASVVKYPSPPTTILFSTQDRMPLHPVQYASPPSTVFLSTQYNQSITVTPVQYPSPPTTILFSTQDRMPLHPVQYASPPSTVCLSTQYSIPLNPVQSEYHCHPGTVPLSTKYSTPLHLTSLPDTKKVILSGEKRFQEMHQRLYCTWIMQGKNSF